MAELTAEEISCAQHIFGAQPPTRTVPIKLMQDKGAGMPVTLRLLDREETLELKRYIQTLEAGANQDQAWIDERLARCLVEINGGKVPWPDALETRRQIVAKWPDPAVYAMAQALADFEDEETGFARDVAAAPFRRGARTGLMFAPRAAGQAAG